MKIHIKKLNQQGFDHLTVLVVFVVFFALVGAWFLYHTLAATTYVELHLGSTSGSCVAGTTVADCNTSNNDQNWATLQGSNFQIKNAAGQCLDDWNGSKVYTSLRINTCYSNDKNQEWNWSNSRLVNAVSKECINADGGNERPGDELIVYGCNSQNDELFYETSISTSGGESGEAGTICRDFDYGTTSCSAVSNAVSQVASNYNSWNSGLQLFCLGELWNRESGWLWYADNPGSGAYGIPQALPGDKMASAGSNWESSPSTQIKWGLGYIKSTYGSPCTAWAHEEADGYY